MRIASSRRGFLCSALACAATGALAAPRAKAARQRESAAPNDGVAFV
jgi:hypothetical protein